MPTAIQSDWRERGATTVELAATIPFILLTMFSGFEAMRAWHYTNTAQYIASNVARELVPLQPGNQLTKTYTFARDLILAQAQAQGLPIVESNIRICAFSATSTLSGIDTWSCAGGTPAYPITSGTLGTPGGWVTIRIQYPFSIIPIESLQTQYTIDGIGVVRTHSKPWIS